MDNHTYDIVIIGGGATGLGSAVDAASRGYKTLLVEQADFGKGTSSRSTKLVHGGVRYLAQGNIKFGCGRLARPPVGYLKIRHS
jgi:glycerol-3-phosphate dehydrogenase